MALFIILIPIGMLILFLTRGISPVPLTPGIGMVLSRSTSKLFYAWAGLLFAAVLGLMAGFGSDEMFGSFAFHLTIWIIAAALLIVSILMFIWYLNRKVETHDDYLIHVGFSGKMTQIHYRDIENVGYSFGSYKIVTGRHSYSIDGNFGNIEMLLQVLAQKGLKTPNPSSRRKRALQEEGIHYKSLGDYISRLPAKLTARAANKAAFSILKWYSIGLVGTEAQTEDAVNALLTLAKKAKSAHVTFSFFVKFELKRWAVKYAPKMNGGTQKTLKSVLGMMGI